MRTALLAGPRITSEPLRKGLSVAELIQTAFQAYNSARIREICDLFEAKLSDPNVVIGMSFTGALTPAGLGGTCIVPLIRAGLIDWIVSTGANLYHDLHFALGYELHRGTPHVNDCQLHREGVVRIYDVLMDYRVLINTDNDTTGFLNNPELETRLGTARLHYLLGKWAKEKMLEREVKTDCSMLVAAHECGVPVYTSSPGDSTIGMDIASWNLVGGKIQIDPAIDVNETTGIVYEAKKHYSKSAVVIWGGGSPKNFMLQTEPQLQEILGFKLKGHDYFIQVTDARPDTGGLSGATPHEAVSWSKIDPEMLPNAVVCYADTTIVLPLLVAYLQEKRIKRPLKRLYDRRDELIAQLRDDFRQFVKLQGSPHGDTKTAKSLRRKLAKTEKTIKAK
ncbi:MAG: deoxyhypusine synthase [Candidatus Alcyoniella australis]|nr:deoxyhypusine synthase [Candidatus Alcyoniella australis]